MRKQLLSAVPAAVLAAALATPAVADADIDVLVTKAKEIDIVETITVRKDVDIFADLTADNLDHAAEAKALANQSTGFNVVNRGESDFGAAPEAAITRTAAIGGSITDNTGVTGVNQDVGNMSNQANLLATAFATDKTEDDSEMFVDAQASVDQQSGFNSVQWGAGVFDSVEVIGRNERDRIQTTVTASMSQSVNANTGVTGVNQNAGNMNNQTNAVSLAAGFVNEETGESVALAESDLGQETSNNTVFEVVTTKESSIVGSVSNNTGITHANQATGNMSNQANVVSLAVVR